MVITILLLGVAACSDSGVSKNQYAEGTKAAQDEGCTCDPFVSDTQSAAQHSDAAQVSEHWRSGYINACVSLRRQCSLDAQAPAAKGSDSQESNLQESNPRESNPRESN